MENISNILKQKSGQENAACIHNEVLSSCKEECHLQENAQSWKSAQER